MVRFFKVTIYFQNCYTSGQTHITHVFLHYNFQKGFLHQIFYLMGVWIYMVGCFQITPQNFLLFVAFKGIKIIICQAKPILHPFLCTRGCYVTSPTQIRGGAQPLVQYQWTFIFALWLWKCVSFS